MARRGNDTATPDHYESALRVFGRYLDEHRPRDIFFFEQEGAYVLRLLQADQTGFHHALVEFMKDDITEMTTRAPTLRKPDKAPANAKSNAKSK